MDIISQEQKKKQKNNEYYVRHYKSTSPIISDLVDDRVKYITPIAHLVFGLMETFGVKGVYIHNGKEIVKFMDNDFIKKYQKRVGKRYIYLQVRILFKILRFLGIDAFERNTDSIKWDKEFKKIERQLLQLLEKSMVESA